MFDSIGEVQGENMCFQVWDLLAERFEPERCNLGEYGAFVWDAILKNLYTMVGLVCPILFFFLVFLVWGWLDVVAEMGTYNVKCAYPICCDEEKGFAVNLVQVSDYAHDMSQSTKMMMDFWSVIPFPRDTSFKAPPRSVFVTEVGDVAMAGYCN